MSDDRDETRPSARSGDNPRPDDAPGAGAAGDATRPDNPRLDDATQADIPRLDDATQADIPRLDDATRADNPLVDDATQADDPRVDDATVADNPPVRDAATARRMRPDSTSVMPAADDWAPGRGNPAWTGRAEVRAPRPAGATYTQQDEWAAPPGREPRDRWWMPIVVGIIALVLLAALGWGIYLIVQNSGGDETPGPAASTPATQAPAPTVTTAATTAATTEPTTEPTTAPPTTTAPAQVEVQIPALAGLTLEEAQAALARSGLQSYKAIYRTDDAPPGIVIGSDPAEGQEVPPDTTVTLVISQGNGQPQTTATTTGSTQQPGGN